MDETIKTGGGSFQTVQMNRYPPSSEIIDSKHAADNISAHIIEDQNLPDRVPIFIQNRSRMGTKDGGRGI